MDSERCPFCGHIAPLLFQVGDLNRRLGGETFPYYRCPSCRLVFLHPHPADLGKYYPQDYYGLTRTLADLEPETAVDRYKIDIVRRYAPAGRLLEVGPSRGAFACLARESGYEVSVIERDAECCRFLSEVAGIQAVNSTDPTAALAEQAPCDVIALWQVIEHLDDPWAFVRTAAGRLNPGGVLVLATPNPDAVQFRLFGRYWVHLDAPRHLQLIPASLLVGLGASLGLREAWLTAADAGVARHAYFGWRSSTAHLLERFGVPGIISRRAGKLFYPLRGVEDRGLRGCTYTLVLQRPA